MIIGLGGNKGAGKNTAANVLINKYNFTEVPFARPLKALCSYVFDIEFKYFDDPILKETPFKKLIWLNKSDINALIFTANKLCTDPTKSKKLMLEVSKNKCLHSPREMLQFVGTDLFRDCVHPLYWCEEYKNEVSKYDKVVTPDVRFPNERETIRNLNGSLILIKRENFVQTDSHISENILGKDSEYNTVLVNNKDITHLQTELENFYLYGKKAIIK